MSEDEWKTYLGITDDATVSDDDMEGMWEEVDEIRKEDFHGEVI